MIPSRTDMSQKNTSNVIRENMTLLCQRRDICDEQRRLTLEQFTELLQKQLSEMNISDVNRIYEAANALDGKLSCEEKTFVCKLLSKDSDFAYTLSKELIDASDDVPEDVRGRIAYVKTEQNDGAFTEFSQQVKDARAFYAPTFSDCCEAVTDNKCEYCILPIENAEGGKLYSFYALIDKYELRICITQRCTTDDDRDVLYALVAKNISADVLSAPQLRFEFTTVGERGEYIGDVIEALRHLSCDIYSLSTTPVEYDYQKQKCIFSVDVPNDSLAPLLIYLENEYPRYTPIGLYKIDKEN